MLNDFYGLKIFRHVFFSYFTVLKDKIMNIKIPFILCIVYLVIGGLLVYELECNVTRFFWFNWGYVLFIIFIIFLANSNNKKNNVTTFWKYPIICFVIHALIAITILISLT